MPNKTEPHVTRYSKCVPSSRLGAVAFGVSHGGVGVSHLAVAGQPLLVSFWRGARRRETAGRLGPHGFSPARACGVAPRARVVIRFPMRPRLTRANPARGHAPRASARPIPGRETASCSRVRRHDAARDNPTGRRYTGDTDTDGVAILF